MPIQVGGSRLPFFCVHPLGGGVSDYAAIARHLNVDQPFYAFRAKGLDDPAQAGRPVEDLAADYLREMRSAQPAGPYALGGYSSGGLIAFEMAQQLAASGEAVALLAMLDSYAPALPGERRPQPAALLNLLRGLPHWLNDFVKLGPEGMRARLGRKLRRARRRRSVTDVAEYVDGGLANLPADYQQFMQAHFQAILAYRPRPYPGRVTLFRGRAQALSRISDPLKGWGPLALGGVTVREFSGSHHTLLAEPHVADLAAQLQAALAGAASA